MKITDRMLEDHKTFRKIIAEINLVIEAPAPSRDQQRLIRLMEIFKDHLKLHAWSEDTFYYDVVRTQVIKTPLPPLTIDYMDSLLNDHRRIDESLDLLQKGLGTPSFPGTWPQLYASFCRSLLIHMKKEE